MFHFIKNSVWCDGKGILMKFKKKTPLIVRKKPWYTIKIHQRSKFTRFFVFKLFF